MIPLTGANAFTTTGLIPTAYDPTDIAFSGGGDNGNGNNNDQGDNNNQGDNNDQGDGNAGKWMYIVNGKSDTGPNPGYGYGNLAQIQFITFPGGNAEESAKLTANNEHQFQLEHATLDSAQVPGLGDLAGLTSQVAANNGYSVTPPASDAKVMSFFHSKIQHIIYVVK